MKDIDTANVAKLVRKELHQSFPGVKFSVRSKRYTGGSSINVDWTNGPTDAQVNGKIGRFHGAEFNPMEDLKEYNNRPYGNDFIFTNRHITEDEYRKAGQEIIDRFAVPEGLSVERIDESNEELLKKWSHWTLRQMAFQHILKDRTLN